MPWLGTELELDLILSVDLNGMAQIVLESGSTGSHCSTRYVLVETGRYRYPVFVRRVGVKHEELGTKARPA